MGDIFVKEASAGTHQVVKRNLDALRESAQVVASERLRDAEGFEFIAGQL